MDCGCNCFGIAASSKRPVKRYNLLVPDIFPKKPPPFREQLDASTERKLKKLYEYLEKNLHRGPKISRRLARRINKDLAAHRLGSVQIAVAAYIYLLEHLRDADSALFAKEVVCQLVAKPVHIYSKLVPTEGCFAPSAESPSVPDSEAGGGRASIGTGQYNYSVAGVLLHHPSAEMRVLGADLLTAFTKQQTNAEYLGYTESFIPLLCGSIAEQPEAEKAALQRLSAACLRALQEQIRLSVRASASLKRLEQIVACLLDFILAAGLVSRLPARAASPNQVSRSHRGSATQLSASNGESKTAPQEGDPSSIAVQIVEDLHRLAQGPAESKRLVEFLLQFADRDRGWDAEGEPSSHPVFTLLKSICRDEQQQYLAFSLLMSHTMHPSLQPQQRLSVVRTACNWGAGLPIALTTAALVLAIKELAPLAGEGGLSPNSYSPGYQESILAQIRDLAGNLADAQHLLEVLGGVAAKSAAPTQSPTALLKCILAAAKALQSYPGQVGKRDLHLPQVLLQELSAMMVHGAPEQQQLAHEVLCQLLSSHRLSIRDDQTQFLCSALWHQVTQRSSPQIFSKAAHTISALLRVLEHQVSQKLASVAEAMKVAALDESSPPDIGSSQRLGLVQLSNWIWQEIQSRGGEEGEAPSSVRLSEAAEAASCLRPNTNGLEPTDSEYFRNSRDAENELQRLQSEFASQSGDRHEDGQVGALLPSSRLKFEPLPLSALQHRGPGTWPGSSVPRSRGPTGDQESNQRANRLRAAMRSQSNQQATATSSGIHTAQDFMRAIETAKAAQSTIQPPRGSSEAKQQMASVLSVIDAVLAAEEGPRPPPDDSSASLTSPTEVQGSRESRLQPEENRNPLPDSNLRKPHLVQTSYADDGLVANGSIS